MLTSACAYWSGSITDNDTTSGKRRVPSRSPSRKDDDRRALGKPLVVLIMGSPMWLPCCGAVDVIFAVSEPFELNWCLVAVLARSFCC